MQWCPTLCNPTDYSPPGSSVHGISQNPRVGCHFSTRGSSQPRDQTRRDPAFQADSLLSEPPGKPCLAATISNWTLHCRCVPGSPRSRALGFVPPLAALLLHSKCIHTLFASCDLRSSHVWSDQHSDKQHPHTVQACPWVYILRMYSDCSSSSEKCRNI